MKKSNLKKVLGALTAVVMLMAAGCSAESSSGITYIPTKTSSAKKYACTVCGAKYSTQNGADTCGKTPSCPGYTPVKNTVDASGTITFFEEAATAYSANGTVASELEGVTAKVASYSWGTLTTATGTATPTGEPTVGKLTGSDFNGVSGAVQNTNDSSKYDINGIVFMPSAVDVGGDKDNRTTALAAGSEYFTLVLDVTAGETDLTLKSISGLVAQANGSGFGTFINGKDTRVTGKAMSLSDVALGDVKVVAGEKTQVTITVKATSDWKAYGNKTASVLFRNIVINAEAEAPAAVTEYECPGCHTKYNTEAEKDNCAKASGCPKYVAPADPAKTGEVSIDITIDDTTACTGCGKEYPSKKEAEACGETKSCPGYVPNATCPECGEGCDSEEDAAAHALADKTCKVCGELKESKDAAEDCAAADLTCEDCGKKYQTKSEADDCEHYKCASCGTSYMSAEELAVCKTQEGCAAYTVKCAECGKDYKTAAEATDCAAKDKTCSNCKTVHGSKAEAEACATEEGCPAWSAECSNCKEHYSTQSAADNCGKQAGCPKFGAVTTITFSGSKVASASSDNAAVTVAVSGNISATDITYNDKKYNPVLKMESATSIVLTGVENKTVTLVSSVASKAIYLNSATDKDTRVAVTGDANGVIVIDSATVNKNIKDGKLSIFKKDSMNIAVIFIE